MSCKVILLYRLGSCSVAVLWLMPCVQTLSLTPFITHYLIHSAHKFQINFVFLNLIPSMHSTGYLFSSQCLPPLLTNKTMVE